MARYDGPGALAGATEADGDRGYAGQRPDATIPLHSSIDARADLLARLRRQRLVEAIHRLPARVIAELLDEIDRHQGIGADLDRRLARYAALDIDTLRTVGGDRFPPMPLRPVWGRS